MSLKRRGSISKMIGKLSSRLMLAILAGAFVSVLAMAFVTLKSGQFLHYAKQSVVAADVLEDGLEARLDAFKFRITGDTSLSESFADNVEEALEGSATLRADSTFSDETHAAIDRGAELIGDYQAAFDRIVELRGPRNEFVADLASTGTQIREQLNEIMESAHADGDPLASVYAGRAQESLLLGRLYMERYLLNNDLRNFERSISELSQAREDLAELLPQLQNPRRRELAQAAEAGLASFGATGQSIFALIEERNGFRAEMDAIGPEYIASVEFVMEQVTARQGEIGNQLRQLGWIVILLLVLSSATILFFSRRTSRQIAAYITGSIERFVVAMTELAAGKTEIDLGRPPDKGTELARMADALEVFRANALEKQELKQREEEQQLQRAEEQKAQLERDEAAKKEAQDRIDRERAALLERLENAVGTVVANAAEGDFSHRVNVDFEEASLRNMAEGINQLLQNVDDGLGATSRVLASLSQGNLTDRMEGDFRGAFADLQANANQMIASLTTLISEIAASGTTVASSSDELRDTASGMSRQAERNAASLEETSAALDELTSSIKQVSENAEGANQNAREARVTAETSSKVAATAVEAMERISTASTEIAKVVSVINDIAFQINLLALNAGVEAARAGEAGRGFSVVASEVRALAQRASEAVREIDSVITESKQAVTEGVEKVTDAQASLEKISESVVGVSALIDDISNAMTEQVSGVTEINSAVAEIDQTVQKQAASLEEVTAASGLLSQEAQGLRSSTARFDTGTATERKMPKAVEPAMPSPAADPPMAEGNLALKEDSWEEF